MTKNVLSSEALLFASYFSNQVEELYKRLKENVEEDTKVVFRKSLIIVPSQAIRSFLCLNLVKDSQEKCLTPVDILSFEEAYQRLNSTTPSKLDVEVSCSELVFYLLTNNICKGPEKECSDAIKASLKIECKEKYCLPDERRILLFIKKISSYFYQAIFHGFPEDSDKNSNSFFFIASLLWKLFLEKNKHLHFPFVKEDLTEKNFHYPSVHLFSFSYIPTKWHELFEKLSKTIPVFYYILSPCMHFWSDILSDSSLKIVQRKIEEEIKSKELCKLYNDILVDRNPFLANCGKKERNFSQLLENSNIFKCEKYFLPSSIKIHPNFEPFIRHDAVIENKKEDKHFSLLEAFQANLLLLQGGQSEKIDIAKEDISIQIHKTPSYLKEIEVLYDELLKLKHKNLFTTSILVGALDISKYAPYIERVFGERAERSFSYQIIQEKKTLSSLSHTFKSILFLSDNRMSSNAMYELYTNSAFLRKTTLTTDDLPLVKALFTKTGFEWGLNTKHREEILQGEGFTTNFPQNIDGTWDESEKKITISQLFSSQKKPSIFLTSQEGERASHVIKTQNNLFYDLISLKNKEETLFNWTSIFNDLLNKYFFVDLDIKEERREFDELQEILLTMKKSARVNKASKFSFSQARELFLSAINESVAKKEFFTKEVVFAPLEFIKNCPTPVVALIGMDSNIEKNQNSNVLNSILSARCSLFISYQSYSFEDDEPREPQTVVKELISSLDKNFTINTLPPSQVLIYDHAISEKPTFSLKQENLPTVHTSNKEPCKEHLVVDLQLLRSCAKSPLKIYFQNSLNLTLYQNDHTNELQSFDLFDIKKEAFFLSHDQFLEKLGSNTKIKLHPMQRACFLHFQEEGQKIREKQERFGLEKRIIELSLQCREPQEILKNHFLLPAPKFEIGSTKVNVYLTGTFDNLFSEGLLFFSKKTENSLFRNFPDLLMCAYLEKTYPEIQKSSIYYLEEETVSDLNLEFPEALLKKFIEYSLECKSSPSLLYPNFVKSIIKGEEEFLKKIKEKNEYEDPYLSLFIERYSTYDYAKLFPQLREKALDIFSHLLEQN